MCDCDRPDVEWAGEGWACGRCKEPLDQSSVIEILLDRLARVEARVQERLGGL